ncbi:beta-hydroxyacyl-ACP dehydratase [Kaistia dalseonensis]|uniref:3-hydroxyacyl-[acyl-carrier-protein] dehydratase n=1 Tax=Kaistia dalseonensis TaxID=410840 RepID=A0ABU0H5U3_9HYPH|nr:3-hydroxyacyl-ACP dehydratase FabZ family protein [Kaistia dalseonensis]MCX5495089.1 beta-hydroxyacyl-ACP dehydratase [Kaistia dalseonensis]MDQ0437671.1 3-hydroxyacyl-[acyl-carrier-protein] dehydratase [Kaistia dalseonensis]
MRLEYFQMIDTVVSFDAATGEIHAKAFVPEKSPIFEGHFPGYPILPGVLLIETMAQASGYLILGMNGLTRMPFFAGVKKAKFRKFIEPGTTLDVYAKMVHEGSGYSVTEGRIEQDGPVCDAELTLRVLDFPAPELKAEIEARAAVIGLGQK